MHVHAKHIARMPMACYIRTFASLQHSPSALEGMRAHVIGTTIKVSRLILITLNRIKDTACISKSITVRNADAMLQQNICNFVILAKCACRCEVMYVWLVCAKYICPHICKHPWPVQQTCKTPDAACHQRSGNVFGLDICAVCME